MRRRFEGIRYRDRIHKAIHTYFNILRVEMFLERVDLVFIDLSSTILVHFPGFLNLSEPLVTSHLLCASSFVKGTLKIPLPLVLLHELQP